MQQHNICIWSNDASFNKHSRLSWSKLRIYNCLFTFKVIGNRLPSVKDKDKLPYVMATLYEVQRIATIGKIKCDTTDTATGLLHTLTYTSKLTVRRG